MRNFLEIEVKYDATGISKEKFETFMNKFTSKAVKGKYLNGVDVYYNKGKSAIRHRHTDENQEITVKKRHSRNSTTVRTEANVALDELPQTESLGTFLRLIGYKPRVSLKKEYLVYRTDYMAGHVEFVWYRVRSKGKPTRSFIEIEVSGTKDDLGILEDFKEVLEKGLGLSQKKILNRSLYEIYK